ncbi:hypothetical protein D3C73_1562580 [compost metagenome]
MHPGGISVAPTRVADSGILRGKLARQVLQAGVLRGCKQVVCVHHQRAHLMQQRVLIQHAGL